jgi:Ca2+-binding RTX toxin-like protein
VALTNSLTTFDGSAATGAIKVTIAAGGTSGVTISTGTGADSVTGGDGGDVINAGSGNDTINGSKGDDVLTGGAGNDVFQFAVGDSSVTSTLFDTITDYSNGTVVNTSDKLDWAVAGVVATTALAGWTVNTGVATKSAATLADFITIVQATGIANETYAFVDGSDTYVYNAGGNGITNATDDTLIKLAGFVGVSVVTADTTAANEIFIA